MIHVAGSHCNDQKDGRNHRSKVRQIYEAAEDLVEGAVSHEEAVGEGGRRSIVPYLGDC